jgi:uncharacterized protein YqjF (DUF2071 family)
MSGINFLDAAARQAALALERGRRPWPLPERPWAQAETREQVLLAHWRAPAEELERLLPPQLELERFEGEAWLGAVAFAASNLRVRGLPPLPGLSSLRELELCTYVTDGSRPGIWLFSLEVSSRLVAEAAKRSHRVPAYHSRVALETAGRRAHLEARRDGLGFVGRFETRGAPFTPAEATLDHFLCERYALYTADGGRLYRAELHHSPWELREARASVELATLAPVAPEGALHARSAERLDLLVWSLEEL